MTRTRIAYDFEFIADAPGAPATVDPVSIGMVDIDNPGRTYYAVFDGFDRRAFARRAFLVDEVLPFLPFAVDHAHGGLITLLGHPDVHRIKPRHEIAADVRAFILDGVNVTDYDTDDPRGMSAAVELWADHAAYDHVCLVRTFGQWENIPHGVPEWTHDVQQEAARTSSTYELPPHGGREHHPLDDALWCAERVRFLDLAAARYLAGVVKAAGYPRMGGPVRPSSVIIGGDGRHPYQGNPL